MYLCIQTLCSLRILINVLYNIQKNQDLKNVITTKHVVGMEDHNTEITFLTPFLH